MGLFSAESQGNGVSLNFVTKAMTLSPSHHSAEGNHSWASKGDQVQDRCPCPIGRAEMENREIFLASYSKGGCVEVPGTARRRCRGGYTRVLTSKRGLETAETMVGELGNDISWMPTGSLPSSSEACVPAVIAWQVVATPHIPHCLCPVRQIHTDRAEPGSLPISEHLPYSILNSQGSILSTQGCY